ncbi:XdhC and CoxI family protein [Halalkalicoccus paucihalophilus]|uniref:XdhC and CoxI family protein n=1 Tax=Halalkalicoccus paucihalophilus TaxID=1008153 RepID=A0A151AB01_9EURY|nr:XdhC/CoxI family protein [Halalkalicoccus paucihalophilus]KYH24793.1 XdhC and CoxI family protein [Halalkalicoccus paucihalophilus]
MSSQEWSIPETDVLGAIHDACRSDRQAVLATIVRVKGSAYRRPGTKMLIDSDGNGVGSLTAGCLENEVRSLATAVLESGESRVERFDLSGDDDVWGLGIGCNGVIDILLEPLTDTFEPALRAFEDGENGTVITVLDSETETFARGDRTYYHDDTSEFHDLVGAWPDDVLNHLKDPASTLATAGNAEPVTIDISGSAVTLFCNGIAAPPELVVFGTGHDVTPVVKLARLADFRVTVVGFRSAATTGDQFPDANRVISSSPAQIRNALELDERTYAVVMSHNFVDDRLALEELVQSPVPYIGLMGPHKRFEEMLEAFADEGRTFTETELSNVYTPIGLDIGSGAPYQIAMSIVSEVLAVHNDRSPDHLRNRDAALHDRIDIELDKQSQ